MSHLFSCTIVYPKFLPQIEHYVDLCTNYTPPALSVLISGLLQEPPDHPQPKTAIQVVPPLYPAEAQHLEVLPLSLCFLASSEMVEL
jgi:hypothetical protein